MAHHAYFVVGERDEGIALAHRFAEGISENSEALPDIQVFQFELFTVDDARRLITAATLSGRAGGKVIVANMTRIFHEAQNALLKILEEPPTGTTIILCVPSEGVFIPTLRSRLLPLPYSNDASADNAKDTVSSQFLSASSAEREKIAGKLIELAKSDKDETKQQARRAAIKLLNGISIAVHEQSKSAASGHSRAETLALLEDIAAFTPILYERSAPLKLILEHLLLVIPIGLGTGKV